MTTATQHGQEEQQELLTEEVIASLDGDEPLELTPHEIYNRLLLESELILTILPEQETVLRKGLIQVKAKENMKLKEQGLPTDTSTLSFQVFPCKALEGAINIHITLAKKNTITVLAVSVPSNQI